MMKKMDEFFMSQQLPNQIGCFNKIPMEKVMRNHFTISPNKIHGNVHKNTENIENGVYKKRGEF